MRIVSPLLKQSCRELKGAHLWLAECSCLKLFACHSLEHGLEGDAKRSHPNTGEVVRCAPYNIVVREEDRGSIFEGFRTSAQSTSLRHEEIENDLLVRGPVPAVCKDKDGFNLYFSKIPGSRVLVFLGSEFAEWGGVLIVFDDVARSYDILEPVPFSNFSTLLAFATDHQHSLELLSHLPHWGVTADELTWRHLQLELLTELNASLLLRLTTSIGNKDVRAGTY